METPANRHCILSTFQKYISNILWKNCNGNSAIDRGKKSPRQESGSAEEKVFQDKIGASVSLLIETTSRPVCHEKFHGAFTLCFQFDSSRLDCAVQWKPAWSVHCQLAHVFRWGLQQVTWGSLTSQGNVLLQVSLFDSGQWRRPCSGQPGGRPRLTQGIDRSNPGGPVTSSSNPVRSSSGSLTQTVTPADIQWHSGLTRLVYISECVSYRTLKSSSTSGVAQFLTCFFASQ